MTAGLGTCVAHAHVLRGVDLIVGAGDVVTIVGSAAAVSTLVLCALGALRPDAGTIRCFGEASHHRVLQHRTTDDLVRFGGGDVAHLHLLDGSFIGDRTRIERWASERAACGDAVLLGTSDAAFAHQMTNRVLRLSGGRLLPVIPHRARVAEGAPK